MHNDISSSRVTTSATAPTKNFHEACAFARAAAKEAGVQREIDATRRRLAEDGERIAKMRAQGRQLGTLLRTIIGYDVTPDCGEFVRDGITFFVAMHPSGERLGIRGLKAPEGTWPINSLYSDTYISSKEDLGDWLARRDLMTVRERARAALASHRQKEVEQTEKTFLQSAETLCAKLREILELHTSPITAPIERNGETARIKLDGVTFFISGEYELYASAGTSAEYKITDWKDIALMLESVERELDRR